jgi:protein MpaA
VLVWPLFAALFIGGCAPGPTTWGTRQRVEPASEPSVEFQSHIAGTSVEGRPIEYHVLGAGDDVVLIMAAIHGDEPTGALLVRRVVGHVLEQPELCAGRRLILLPVANPDGLTRHQRHNVRGVDLNRNFPASNWRADPTNGAAPLSEPESWALHALLNQYCPERIVTIHEPLGCIDYDGPAEALARVMHEASGLPVKKLGARPGSLGSFAGLELGVPIVTVELPASARDLDDDALWDRYGPMLLAAIRYGPI